MTQSEFSKRVDKEIVEIFIKNENFPFLVSFPRTGSHFLRMLMEAYFKRPCLVRTFYYPNKKNYTCYHTHDLKLEVKRKNIIYLHRNPIDVVYSQLKYNNEEINEDFILSYSYDYKRHLDKWFKEEFSEKKTIISYEDLIDKPDNEFKKICNHLNLEFNKNLFNKIYLSVTKEEVKKRTGHDSSVINLSQEYKDKKENFKSKYGDYILKYFAYEK